MKVVVIILICFIFLSCRVTTDYEIYVTNNSSQILLKSNEEVKILHSGIATMCDRFQIIEEGLSNGKLYSLNKENSSYYDTDTLTFKKSEDALLINNISFNRLQDSLWDSITISELRNKVPYHKEVILPAASSSGEKQLLASTLLLNNFQYLRSDMVESNLSVALKLFLNNKVIAAKNGANKFTCIDYD